MADQAWYTDASSGFQVQVAEGWSVEQDAEEGGVEIWSPSGAGSLHLLGFAHAAEDVSDPAEELYAFLEEQGVELEEDEVEDLELAGGAEMAICEYIAQDEPGDEEADAEPIFWLMGVAAGSECLVFASYSCPAGEEEPERDTVRAMLASLRLGPTD
jgi:hypothetical protein